MSVKKDLGKDEIRNHLKRNKMEYKIGSNNNLILLYCPFCQGGEHRDKYSFAINERTGAYICFQAKCGVKGHFNQLKNEKKGKV